MLIKFSTNVVTPYGFTKNSEEVVAVVESVKGDKVQLGVFNISNLSNRGNISELANNQTFDIPLSSIKALNKIKEKLLSIMVDEVPKFELGVDFELMQDLTWLHEDKSIRVSISMESVISNYSPYIEVEKAKGNPYYIVDDYVVLYINQILPEHRVLIEADINVLIEE